MTTRESWTKCLPHTQRYVPGTGQPEKTREDVLLASQGISSALEAYIELTVMGIGKARHGVYAGLLREALRIRELLAIHYRRPGKIDRMCQLASLELDPSLPAITAQDRADFLKVSRRTWFRRYKAAYERILSIPGYWEEAEFRRVGRRLK